MHNNNDDDIFWQGAWKTAIIAFLGTWITSIVLFNFLGLVLGWLPALIVAAVVWATFPFLYILLLPLIFLACFAAFAALSFFIISAFK